MISLRVFAIVAIVGALALGLVACDEQKSEKSEYGGGCISDEGCVSGLLCCWGYCLECCEEEDCASGLHCCNHSICKECCDDKDCERDEKCDDYECVWQGPPPPTVAPYRQPWECDTDAQCAEGLYCCDDYACHECCSFLDCDQGENCDDYECVPRQEPPPAPEEEAQTPEIFVQFLDSAWQSGDWEALVNSLHPLVFEFYPRPACVDFMQRATDPPPHIEFLSAERTSWQFDSTPVADVWEVRVNYTVEGQTSVQVVHFAGYDHSLGWFARCDSLLPLPVEPECSSDQDCPDGSRCNAGGECAEEQQTPDWVSITGINPPGLFGWPEAYGMPHGIPTIDDCGHGDGTVTHVCDRGQELTSAPVDAQGNFVLLFPWPGVSTGWVWGGLTLWDGDHQVRGFIGAPFDLEPDGRVRDGVLYLDVGELTIVFECPHP